MSTMKGETTSTSDQFSVTTVKDMINDKSLIKHRHVLEQIYKFIIQAIDNDDKWSVKCQALKSEISESKTKIQAAVSLSEMDRKTIDALKAQLKKAWNDKNELKKQQKERDNEKNGFDAKISELTKKNQNLRFEVKRYQSELRSVKSQDAKEKSSENDNLKKEIAILKDAVASKEKIVKAMEAKIKKNEEKFKSQVIETTDFDEKFKKIEDYKLQIHKLHEQLAIKENEVEDLTKSHHLKLEAFQKLTGDLQGVNKVLEPLLNMAEKKSEVLTEIEHELKNIKNKLIPFINKLKKPVLTQTTSMKDRNVSEKEMKEMKARNLRLQEFLTKEMMQKKHLHERLIQYQSWEKQIRYDLEEKICEAEHLQRNCNKLKVELDKQTSLVKNLEKIRDKQANEIEDLEVKMQMLKKEFDRESKIASEETDIKYKICQMKSDLEAEKELVTRLQFEHRMAVKDLNTYKETVSKDMENLKSLLEEILISKTEIMRLCGRNNNCIVETSSSNRQECSVEIVRDEIRTVFQLTKLILDDRSILSEALQSSKSSVENLKQKLRDMSSSLKSKEDEISQLQKTVTIVEEKGKCDKCTMCESISKHNSQEAVDLPIPFDGGDSVNMSMTSITSRKNLESDIEKVTVMKPDIKVSHVTSLCSTTKSKSNQDMKSLSYTSNPDMENLMKTLNLQRDILDSKTKEIISQSMLLSQKEKEIKKLQKTIKNEEKTDKVLKYKNELSKSNKALKEMEKKAREYENCIREHQIEEIKLTAELQRLKTRPRNSTRLVLPDVHKAWPAKSTKFYMSSKFA